MKRVRSFLLPLFCMVLLLILAVPAAAADVSYAELDDAAYFTIDDRQLTGGERAKFALYLREIHAYAGFETYVAFQSPEGQPLSDWAEDAFASRGLGENAILLAYDEQADTAALVCGSALDGVLSEQARAQVEHALLTPSDSYPNAGEPTYGTYYAGAKAHMGSGLCRLVRALFGGGRYAYPAYSYLSYYLDSGYPLSLDAKLEPSEVAANGFLTEAELAQLSFLVEYYRTGDWQIEVVQDATLSELEALCDQRRLILQSQTASHVNVLAYAVDSNLLSTGETPEETGVYEVLIAQVERSVREEYRNSSTTELADNPVCGPIVAGVKRTLKARGLLGACITGGVLAVLIAVFVIAMLLRSQSKQRCHEPLRPGGVNVNANYPHYVEPVDDGSRRTPNSI